MAAIQPSTTAAARTPKRSLWPPTRTECTNGVLPRVRCEGKRRQLFPTRRTSGSAFSPTLIFKSKRPRVSASSRWSLPPCPGRRSTKLGCSKISAEVRFGNVSWIVWTGSVRSLRVIAPERPQRSQPPPEQATHVRLRGSSSSTVSPASSQSRGRESRWTTSGPRAVSKVPVTTRPMTWDKLLKNSAAFPDSQAKSENQSSRVQSGSSSATRSTVS